MKKMEKKDTGNETMRVTPYNRLVSMAVHSENIFHFPEGLPAFEHVKEFIFLLQPDTKPFVFMHALKPNDLAFACIDPFIVYPEYRPQISEADRIFLHLDKPDDALILSIVTVRADATRTTTNLQGPIVINIQTSVGKQIICDNQNYPVRHKIWDTIGRINSNASRVDERVKTPVQV